MELLFVCFVMKPSAVEARSVDVMNELTTTGPLSQRIYAKSADLCLGFLTDSIFYQLCLFPSIKLKFFMLSLSGRI